MTVKFKEKIPLKYFKANPGYRNNLFARLGDEDGDEPQIQTLGGVVPDVPETVETPEEINYGFGRVVEQPSQLPQTSGNAFSDVVEPENVEKPVEPKPEETRKKTVDSDIERLEGLIYDPAQKNAPENKPNRWKAGAGLAMKNIAQVLMSGGSWGDAVGAGIGGFGGGAFNPKAFADLKHGDQLGWLYKKREEARREEDRQIGNQIRRVQMANILADNEIKAEEEKRKKRTEFYRRNKFFDPAKASPAQIRELSEFGETPETIGSYDFTNPKFRRVNGEEYRFNPNTNSFMPTDLPADKSKAVQEYQIQDPETGTTSTYWVSSEKAAQFENSMRSAKLNIIANRELNQARLQVEVDKFNSTQAFQAQKENVENTMAYNKQVFDQTMTIIKADSANAENVDEMVGAYNKMETIRQQYLKATDDDDRNKLALELAKAEGEYATAVGKTKAGQQALTQLESQNIKRPGAITAVKIPTVKIGGGGRYSGQTFPSPSALRSAFPGKKDDEIRQIVEANGGRFQN